MDAGGLCTFANDRWCELTGMTEADALGIGWSTALHPDDAVRMEREWAVAAARGTELRTDCRLISANGSEVWVHASAVPLLTSEGLPAGFLAAVIDVSARKRAEEDRERLLAAERAARRSLADQTERLNSLIANAIPAIMVRDEDGQIAQVNASFGELFGITVPGSQLVGTSAAKLANLVKGTFADPAEFLRWTAGLSDAGSRPRASSSAPRTAGPSKATTGRSTPRASTAATSGSSGTSRSARHWRRSGNGCCRPSSPPGTRPSRRSSGLPSRTSGCRNSMRPRASSLPPCRTSSGARSPRSSRLPS